MKWRNAARWRLADSLQTAANLGRRRRLQDEIRRAGENFRRLEQSFRLLLDLFGPSRRRSEVRDQNHHRRPAHRLKENTVEEAIARAFQRPADAVRRANMILGDIGETAVLAKRDDLDRLALAMFRPVKFMLATPADTEDEIFATFPAPFYVEDKYDGIRGQFHVSEGRAALYSRTLDDVAHQFPEIS